MKKVFIYYSLSNNGDVVADYFRDNGYDIRKVITKRKYPNNMFFRILLGGFRASFNKKDKLVDFNTDIKDYDKIVIGSPVWNDRLSAPINSVIDLLDLKDKDITFILYSASGKALKAKEKIKKLYNINAIVLKEPKNNIDELDKIKGI